VVDIGCKCVAASAHGARLIDDEKKAGLRMEQWGGGVMGGELGASCFVFRIPWCVLRVP
jgi:hypothetical protein